VAAAAVSVSLVKALMVLQVLPQQLEQVAVVVADRAALLALRV
jgi:hypothetical protein